ncbi:MAG: CPBP family intramembrane metalloprotease [Mariniblastus sp.]|nr:CPBP family intramembrane metalloprotease [Mariniblastus sp.]
MNDNQSIQPAQVTEESDDGRIAPLSGPIFNPDYLLLLVLLLEGTLVVIALLISCYGFYDPQQPLSKIDFQLLLESLFWGGLATIPLVGYLFFFHFFPVPVLRPLRDVVERDLAPLFKRLKWYECALIALLAGFCEELLFRWALQGGIGAWIGGPEGVVCGLLVSSLLFGLCHWVNKEYAATTFLIGLYFGALMIWSGTFLVPAVSHFLFDWVAIIYIVKWVRPPVPEG